LKDVFALKARSRKSRKSLGAQVSSDEKAAIEEPPTTDLVAYDAYLRAKDLINGNTFSPRAKEDLFQAVELLSQAVARDPSFFNAYYELAAAHDKIYFLGFDHTKARLELPRQPFNPFVARVPNLERHIWPSLITCIGPIAITTKPRQSWQSQALAAERISEFLF
jgi:hypothetical protein